MTAIQEIRQVPAGIEPKIIALSTKTESSYSFQSLIDHEAFKNYEGPILTTDFVVTADTSVTKRPILVEDILVGFTFTGIVNGVPRTIINIDHHDKDPRMQRAISSANLATLYVSAFEKSQEYPVRTQGKKIPVTISHYDCDSICASAILSGSIDRQYWPKLEEAVLAADHTGKENLIADTLQGLDELMSDAQLKKEKGEESEGILTKKSLAYCFESLRAILSGKSEQELPQIAREALHFRRNNRKEALAFLTKAFSDSEGKARNAAGEIEGEISILDNNIYYIKIRDGNTTNRDKIATELLSGLLPEAIAIVVASPLKRNRARWEVAVRAGIKGMKIPGFNFHNLNLDTLFKIGGRWNAGSSGRNGGQEKEEDADAVAFYIATHAKNLFGREDVVDKPEEMEHKGEENI